MSEVCSKTICGYGMAGEKKTASKPGIVKTDLVIYRLNLHLLESNSPHKRRVKMWINTMIVKLTMLLQKWLHNTMGCSYLTPWDPIWNILNMKSEYICNWIWFGICVNDKKWCYDIKGIYSKILVLITWTFIKCLSAPFCTTSITKSHSHNHQKLQTTGMLIYQEHIYAIIIVMITFSFTTDALSWSKSNTLHVHGAGLLPWSYHIT